MTCLASESMERSRTLPTDRPDHWELALLVERERTVGFQPASLPSGQDAHGPLGQWSKHSQMQPSALVGLPPPA